MSSYEQPDLDELEGLARTCVSGPLGLEGGVVERLRGGQHAVFLVSTHSERFVLKAFGEDEPGWAREAVCMRLLGEQFAPVLRGQCRAGAYVFVLADFVHGKDMRELLVHHRLEREQSVRSAAIRAAELLPRIHGEFAKDATRFAEVQGRDPLLKLTEADSASSGIERELRADRLGARRCSRVVAMVDACRDLESALQDVCCSHGDFQAKNLMVDESAQVRVIDWEFLRLAPRIADCVMLWRYTWWLGLDVSVMRPFVADQRLGESRLLQLAFTYEVAKISLGISRSTTVTSDFPLWSDYLDACLLFLETGNNEELQTSSQQLLKGT
ncbi:phosphotransferase family protein [Archangium violaceum]|uniref:phosphotransferase family protein n=1 Tax=Archangium violaceum TaxID=83451 RepID=UPI0036DCE8C1